MNLYNPNISKFWFSLIFRILILNMKIILSIQNHSINWYKIPIYLLYFFFILFIYHSFNLLSFFIQYSFLFFFYFFSFIIFLCVMKDLCGAGQQAALPYLSGSISPISFTFLYSVVDFSLSWNLQGICGSKVCRIFFIGKFYFFRFFHIFLSMRIS